MEQIFGIIIIIVLAIAVMAFTMHFVMRRSGRIKACSACIINAFELGDAAPKMTELIAFHKSNGAVRYIID